MDKEFLLVTCYDIIMKLEANVDQENQGRISKKKKSFWDEWNFKPKFSPMFHFELVNEGWIITTILCANMYIT